MCAVKVACCADGVLISDVWNYIEQAPTKNVPPHPLIKTCAFSLGLQSWRLQVQKRNHRRVDEGGEATGPGGGGRVCTDDGYVLKY